MKIAAIFFASCILLSCSEHKGWTESDKRSFIKKCIADNKTAIGEDKVNKYCACMQEKAQQLHENYSDIDRLSMSENLDMSNECAPRGWSKSEENVFMTNCTESFISNGGDTAKATPYCDCMMRKIQVKYPDVTKTGSIPNEEINAMAEECLLLYKDENH